MNQFIRVCFVFLITSILVSSFGCSARLAGPKDIELDLGSDDIRTFLVDPSGSEHSLSIVAASDGPPIKVFIYLSENEEVVDRAIMFGQESDKIIGSQSGSAEISLTVKIPADKEASVRLQTAGPQAAKVKLTIDN